MDAAAASASGGDVAMSYPVPEYGQPLSPDERQILHAVARGLTDVEMAAELYMSRTTIKDHLKRMTVKLGARARNRPNLVALGFARGYLVVGTGGLFKVGPP